MTDKQPTASALLIGNELLSGRTQDDNLRYVAVGLAEIGVRLEEARIVPDVESRIVEALDALRARYDYVFTTGGIGPTHDDITVACVAKALHLPLAVHPEALARLERRYGKDNMNDSRRKMALFPEGCKLLDNAVNGAPGFYAENVYVMAGIPNIMRSMFDHAKGLIRRGAPVLSREVDVPLPESAFAAELEEIQNRYAPDVEIGSYPYMKDGKPCAAIVLRGTDAALLERAAEEVRRMAAG